MAFSPDAKVLALPKGDGRVELWNLETGKAHVLVSAFNKEGFPADRVAFSDGGRLLAVLYREPGVVIWDLSQNKERTFIAVRLPQYVDDFAFGDADRTLVTIMGRFMTFSAREFRRGHSAVVWDSLNGEKKADHVFDPIHVFKAISPDGRYAVMQSSEGQTGFDLVTGKRAFAVNGEGEFAFSRDGLALACYNGEEAWLWDVPSGQRLRYFAFRPSYCAGAYCWQRGGVAISPDKTLLAAANFLQTNVVGVISLETGTAVAELECGPSIMLSDVVLFSPDGRLVATDTQKVDGNDRQVQPPLKLWRVLDSWRGTSQRGAQVGSASESSEKARNIRPPIPRVGKAPP
jgi:WD40 repeat protein